MTTPTLRTLADDLTSFSANFNMFVHYRENIDRVLPEMQAAGHDTDWFLYEWAAIQEAYASLGSPTACTSREHRILLDRVRRLAKEIQIVAYPNGVSV